MVSKKMKKSIETYELIKEINLLFKIKRCIICRNEASNFCKDMRVPVCSKECKAKHMEEVATLSRFCNRPHESVMNQFVLDALAVFKFLCAVSKEDPAK